MNHETRQRVLNLLNAEPDLWPRGLRRLCDRWLLDGRYIDQEFVENMLKGHLTYGLVEARPGELVHVGRDTPPEPWTVSLTDRDDDTLGIHCFHADTALDALVDAWTFVLKTRGVMV